MEYRIELNHDQRLISVHTNGDADINSCRNIVTDLLNPPFMELEYNILIDMTSLDLSPLNMRDIRSLIEMVLPERRNLKPYKQAIVTGSLVTFGIARTFQILSDDSLPVETRVFRDMDIAVQWINSDQTNMKPPISGL